MPAVRQFPFGPVSDGKSRQNGFFGDDESKTMSLGFLMTPVRGVS